MIGLKRMVTVADIKRRERRGALIIAILALIVGLLLLTVPLDAVLHGAVRAPNKYQSIRFSLSADPVIFWGYILWWTLFAACAFLVGAKAVRKLLANRKNSNASFNTDASRGST
jgi:formate-dependent nitrite reductase membrane component NrfD